jgi:EAL domain-containing protein (putative c-di-GMP-specific phosphodiesterase class I)
MFSSEIGLEFARGAIAGAMLISAAYLAGFAVFRRGSAAVCALLMVVAAGALQATWLGLVPAPSPRIVVLLQGLFGAAALIYLSSTVRSARDNALLGGLMFAAALILVGLGVINLVLSADAAGLMRAALVLVGIFAAVLAVSQARRDIGARLLLPGVVVALAAPFAGVLLGGGEAAGLAFNVLFAFGVVATSLVSLTEAGGPRLVGLGLRGDAPAMLDAVETPAAYAPERAMRISENQLARVLDYSGVTVWDWSPEDAHQTEGLPTLMGADSSGLFTPEAMPAFIHKDDRQKFETQVLARGKGDGAFDVVLRLLDGRQLRFRGARAVDSAGEIERIVAFIESLSGAARSAKGAAPLTGSGAAGADKDPLVAAIAEALAKGELSTAFQPIVSLGDARIVGYEALIRWPGVDGGPEKASAEASVRAAEAAGKDGELARFVLKASAAHLAAQMKELGRRDLFVAMNLSVIQLRDSDFDNALREAFREHDLPPKSLVLEITETQAIDDIEGAGEKFRAFKAVGAALAFDDFGAGFSSLSNLRQFEFDYLKIDKQFVQGLTKGGDAAKISRAIAQLGRDLGLTVIAEGVEDKDTAIAAELAGCTLAQGFAFGAPIAAPRTPEGGDASAAGDSEPGDSGKSRRNLWRGALR